MTGLSSRNPDTRCMHRPSVLSTWYTVLELYRTQGDDVNEDHAFSSWPHRALQSRDAHHDTNYSCWPLRPVISEMLMPMLLHA